MDEEKPKQQKRKKFRLRWTRKRIISGGKFISPRTKKLVKRNPPHELKSKKLSHKKKKQLKRMKKNE